MCYAHVRDSYNEMEPNCLEYPEYEMDVNDEDYPC